MSNRHGAHRAIGNAALIATVGALGAVQISGCGGATTLGAARVTQLRTDIAAARTAAANGDRAAVQSALTALAHEVSSLRASGALPAARAATLQTEINHASARVPVDVAPATAATPAPLAQAPTPAPDAGGAQPHDHGNGKDHGNGPGKDHGKGKGDGGD